MIITTYIRENNLNYDKEKIIKAILQISKKNIKIGSDPTAKATQ